MGEAAPREEATYDVQNQDGVDLRSNVHFTITVTGLGHTVQLKVMDDPEDPDLSDNKATLYTEDGSYVKTIEVDDCEAVDGGRMLRFENVEVGKKYSLLIDPGAAKPDYHLFADQMLTEGLLEQLKAGTAPTGTTPTAS